MDKGGKKAGRGYPGPTRGSVASRGADLERLNSVELFECFRLLVHVTHGQHIRRHFRDDVPRKNDVIVYCVLSTDRKSDDVVVVDKRRNHVYLARHVDCSQ